MPTLEIDHGGPRPVHYDSFGDEAAPALMLVSGLGLQGLEVWDDRFCAELAGLGVRAIRFDNRDTRRDNEGCASAKHWAIIPPMEMPATCTVARGPSSASVNRRRSSAMWARR